MTAARLSDLADAAEAMRDRLSAAAIARMLGHSTSTITRRTGPVLSWSASEVLALALTDADFGRCVCQAIATAEEQRRGDPAKVASDLIAEVQQSHALHEQIIESLADGRVSPAESAQLRQLILRRHDLDSILLRDLKAIAGEPNAGP